MQGLNLYPDTKDRWGVYNRSLAEYMSESIQGLPAEERLSLLRGYNPDAPVLVNIYRQALGKEDYETCAAAVELLKERTK